MTWSRRSMQKSMSKSGIETRSGLRKRSKRRLYGIGSRSVMRIEYATIDPAPEPETFAIPVVVDLLANRLELGETRRETLGGDVAEIGLGVVALRHLEAR